MQILMKEIPKYYFSLMNKFYEIAISGRRDGIHSKYFQTNIVWALLGR